MSCHNAHNKLRTVSYPTPITWYSPKWTSRQILQNHWPHHYDKSNEYPSQNEYYSWEWTSDWTTKEEQGESVEGDYLYPMSGENREYNMFPYQWPVIKLNWTFLPSFRDILWRTITQSQYSLFASMPLSYWRSRLDQHSSRIIFTLGRAEMTRLHTLTQR